MEEQIRQRIAELKANRERELVRLTEWCKLQLKPFDAAIGELEGILALKEPSESEPPI